MPEDICYLRDISKNVYPRKTSDDSTKKFTNSVNSLNSSKGIVLASTRSWVVILEVPGVGDLTVSINPTPKNYDSHFTINIVSLEACLK